jgi:hypothetical protein
MTTHFTSGVTNVGGASTLGKLKMPAPSKYHLLSFGLDDHDHRRRLRQCL